MSPALKEFRPFLKAFGTGPKGNRELSYEESYQACRFVLEQNIPPEVIGAFLISWRVQAESITEMLGALKALKENMQILPAQEDSIEIAFPMEGKKKNIPLIFLTATFLPQENFVMTTSKAAQIPTANSLLQLEEYLPSNVTLVKRNAYLPELEALQMLRNNLGLRTVFNTLEKLHHPLKSRYAVIGAHHGPYFKKYAALFSPQYERMMIVQGDEGCGEIIKKSKIEIIKKGEVVEQFTLDPQEFGIAFTKPEKPLPLLEVIQQLKEPSDALLKLAKLNAALYLYMKEHTRTVKEIYDCL